MVVSWHGSPMRSFSFNIGVLLLALMGMSMPGTAMAQLRLADSPPPANAPEGLAPGLIAAFHDDAGAEGPVRLRMLSLRLSFNFSRPEMAKSSASFAGQLVVPAGGMRGSFHFDTPRNTELLIDGKVVASKVAGDAKRTFEKELDLAAGVHPIAGKIFGIEGPLSSQPTYLTWKSGGKLVQAPAEWFWHAKADETPKLVGGSGPPIRGRHVDPGWISAGTPRPSQPDAKPDDLIAGAVFARYSDSAMQRLEAFTTVGGATFQFQAAGIRVFPPGGSNLTFKLAGVLRADADYVCAFNCRVAGTITVAIDGRDVSQVANPGDTRCNPVRLTRGVHPFELVATSIIEDFGPHVSAFLWSVNDSEFTAIPDAMVGHYRSQEPYADAAAGQTASIPPAAPGPALQPPPGPVTADPRPAPAIATKQNTSPSPSHPAPAIAGPIPVAEAKKHPFARNAPGPMVVIIDRFGLNPRRTSGILARISKEIATLHPAADLKLVLVDAKPLVINCTVSDYLKKPDVQHQLQTAMLARSPGGNLEKELLDDLKSKPTRLSIYLDSSVDFKRMLAMMHEQDPQNEMVKGFQFCGKSDAEMSAKIRVIFQTLGLFNFAGSAVDPPK